MCGACRVKDAWLTLGTSGEGKEEGCRPEAHREKVFTGNTALITRGRKGRLDVVGSKISVSARLIEEEKK